MAEDVSPNSNTHLRRDALEHNRSLLLALSRAAQSIQRARTVEEVYRVVGGQIKFLRGDVSLLMTGGKPNQITIAYTSYDLRILQKAEKLLGLSALGYRFSIPPDGVFARGLANGRAIYLESTCEYTTAMLPGALQALAGRLMRILKVNQGIFAPLCLDSEKLGVMLVSGSFITEDDVPAMESFAAQIAISLHNVRLTQQMQSELSARKQVEEELRKSEERYRSLFDDMLDGVYRSTHAGRFVDLNAAMVKMFGYSSREEMLAVDIKSELYFSPEERGSHILDTGQEEIEVYRMRRKDGSEIWVEDHGHYVHDEQGNILYHEGILRDVTARKKAEDNAFLQNAALEAAANAIAITDKHGTLQWVNRAWVTLTGYSKEESIGQNVRIIKSGKHDQAFYRKMWQTILAGEVWRGELVNRRKDGSLYYEEETITPVLDDQGNVTHFIAIKLDITERKEAESSLERLARTDALTGINNRRHLFELAVHEFEVARRYGHPLSVIMLDLDHFKDVNDTFGHAVGDQILQSVTQVARSQLRDVDLIGRYGGEEFVIILPVTSARQSSLVAERIRGGVESLRIETDKGPASVTLSLGIAEMFHAPQDGSVDDMIRRADEALYAAKKAGRNRAVIFEAG